MSDEFEHEIKIKLKVTVETEKDEDRDEGEDKTYERYLAQRNSLYNNSVEQSNLFDTQLLAISAATLGFSVAFIEKIVTLNSATSITCLYISWSLLLVSTLSTLASFKMAETASNSYQSQLDTYYNENGDIKYDLSSKFGNLTTYLNFLSLAAFYIGVAFLCFFIAVNLTNNTNNINQKGNTMTQNSTTKILTEGKKPNSAPEPQQKSSTQGSKSSNSTPNSNKGKSNGK